MGKGVNIIHANCDPDLAQDRTLPHTAYLIEFDDGNGVVYDIVVASKRVDIFDYYWDKYRDVRGLKWTDGKANPKMWGYKAPESKKRK